VEILTLVGFCHN